MVLQGSMVVPLAVEIGVKSYASTTNGSMCISRYLHDPPVAAPPSCPATVPNPSSKKEPAPRAASCPPCHEQSDGGGFLQDSHRMVSEHEFGKKP